MEEQLVVNQSLIKMSQETGIPGITNDVHLYIRRMPEPKRYLSAFKPEEIEWMGTGLFQFRQGLFEISGNVQPVQNIPGSINTVEIANRCNVEIEFGRPVLPILKSPQGYTLMNIWKNYAWKVH